MRDATRDLVVRLRPVAEELGCEATGAELQRAVYGKRGSLQDVVGYLLDAVDPA